MVLLSTKMWSNLPYFINKGLSGPEEDVIDEIRGEPQGAKFSRDKILYLDVNQKESTFNHPNRDNI